LDLPKWLLYKTSKKSINNNNQNQEGNLFLLTLKMTKGKVALLKFLKQLSTRSITLAYPVPYLKNKSKLLLLFQFKDLFRSVKKGRKKNRKEFK